MKPCAVVPVYRHVRTVGTVLDALLAAGLPCIVVDDGNEGGEAQQLARRGGARAGVELVSLPQNQGKGAAIQAGMRTAGARGYTHALQIDADGQHDTADIGRFLELARAHRTT